MRSDQNKDINRNLEEVEFNLMDDLEGSGLQWRQ